MRATRKAVLPQRTASYVPQALNFFARMATQPSTTAKSAYNKFIATLVRTGVWAKLDGLYVLAAQDPATACLNLVQNAFNCTITGTPTWVPYRSMRGSGSSYLNTGFNAGAGAGKWQLSSATLGLYFVTLDSFNCTEIGADRYAIFFGGGKTPFYKFNNSSSNGAQLCTQGLISGSRTGTTVDMYYNGVSQASTTISAGILATGNSMLIGAANVLGTVAFGLNELGLGFFGASLTAADHLLVTNSFERYLTDVSALQFYVDFSAGTNGNGTLASPWNVLTPANAWFGDMRGRTLFLKRGTSARTMLAINGASSVSLTKNYNVDAYGTGELPKIDGSNAVSGASWTLDTGAIYYLTGQTVLHQPLLTDVTTGWTLDASGIYYQTGKNQGRQHYDNGTRLQSVVAKSKMVNGTQFYDNAAQRQYIKTTDGTDPAGHTITVVIRLWYVTSKANMVAGTMFFDLAATRLYIWLPDSGNPLTRTIDLTARKAVQCNFVDTATIGNIWSDKSDDNGVEVHFSKSVVVTNTLATHFGADPISDGTGFDYWGANTLQSTGYVCRYNESAFGTNCSYQSHYTTGDIVTDNYFHDNQQGVELWDTSDGPSIATRNIIQDIGFGLPANALFTGHANALWLSNDSGSSIHVCSFYSNLIVNMNSEVYIVDAGMPTIRNNTVYQLVAGRGGQKVLKAQKAGTPTVTVNYHNNITYLGAAVAKDMMDIGNAGATVTSNYNTFYVSGGTPTFYYGGALQASFAAYKAASGQDANSTVNDPLFTNATNFDFTLQAGSPARAAGDGARAAATDYNGVPYGSPPNLGAYAT